MATAAEISEFDTEELERQLAETRRELFNLRFQLATGQLDNFSRINHVRKDVARMMTELRIREIGEAEGLALEDLPGHQAAARRRTEDEALGRDKTTASERRAAAKADAEDDHDGHDHARDDLDEDELAEEVADDDGMAVPDDEDADGVEALADADVDDRRQDAGDADRRRRRRRGEELMADEQTVPEAEPGQRAARCARAWWCPTPWTPPWWWPSSSGCAIPGTARPCSGPSGSTPTTPTTRPRWGTGSVWWRPAHCPSSSAGGSSEVLERAR